MPTEPTSSQKPRLSLPMWTERYAAQPEIQAYLRHVAKRFRLLDHIRFNAEVSSARYDELFQFIRFCITGENHPVRLTEIPLYLDWLATADFHHGVSPMVENRYLAVVAIDGFPAESWPGILNALDLMPLTVAKADRRNLVAFGLGDGQDGRRIQAAAE